MVKLAVNVTFRSNNLIRPFLSDFLKILAHATSGKQPKYVKM